MASISAIDDERARPRAAEGEVGERGGMRFWADVVGEEGGNMPEELEPDVESDLSMAACDVVNGLSRTEVDKVRCL